MNETEKKDDDSIHYRILVAKRKFITQGYVAESLFISPRNLIAWMREVGASNADQRSATCALIEGEHFRIFGVTLHYTSSDDILVGNIIKV